MPRSWAVSRCVSQRETGSPSSCSPEGVDRRCEPALRRFFATDSGKVGSMTAELGLERGAFFTSSLYAGVRSEQPARSASG